MSDNRSTQTAKRPRCEACGEAATQQDAEGVWLCDADMAHLVEHWRLEDFSEAGAQRIL